MTTYYVDPAGSNTSPYDTWAKAATSLQTVADTAVAGDVVYCRGTETLAARVDFDTNSGTNAAGFIKFIGCNASGNRDGTRFILDANGGSYAVCYFTNAVAALWFENIEVQNTAAGAYGGFHSSSWDAARGCVFINCSAHNCGSDGFGVNALSEALLVRCVAYSNGGYGIRLGTNSLGFACCARDNASLGFYIAYAFLVGCISHNNTDDGVSLNSSSSLVNCVVDGNGDDGIVTAASATNHVWNKIIGCRITNHSGAGDIGLNCNSENFVAGWCYLEDNDGENIQNATLFQPIPNLDGTTTNVEDQADTNEGYAEAVANHNFATNYVDGTDPSLRRTAITVPWS